ncbi:hypothetical protein E4U53_006679 [Claviceps sorghi]|nr:hypothetical protein E4U53_006679 [Claviceps sorghi]
MDNDGDGDDYESMPVKTTTTTTTTVIDFWGQRSVSNRTQMVLPLASDRVSDFRINMLEKRMALA